MKVVILGGGIAGCSAAYFLKNKGITDITLVELNKIGGCCRTKFWENIPYEFGPQILYTHDENIKEVFELFINNVKPRTEDGKYHPAVSIDDTINKESVFDFPVTISNVIKLKDCNKIINELYHVNLKEPDYSNFENYIISRVGNTLYELFFKNYNIKMWKIHPKDMDTEWAKFRNFTLKEKGLMFGDKWQGHPGNHNPIFDGFTKDIKITKGIGKIEENGVASIDNLKIDADLIISTLPISNNLDYINHAIFYFVVKSENFVMPSYTTSFPNHYSFTRVIEYKQQFYVNSEYSLLSFEFPFLNTNIKLNECVTEIKHFLKNIINKEYVDSWVTVKKNVYPVSTKKNLDLFNKLLFNFSTTNIFPLGRMGMFAYISKDTCVGMSKTLSENLDVAFDNNSYEKLKLYSKIRSRLS